LLAAVRIKINEEFRKNKDVMDITAIDEVLYSLCCGFVLLVWHIDLYVDITLVLVDTH